LNVGFDLSKSKGQTKMARVKKEITTQPVEQVLWASADKLRKNMDAAEYKHIVLGLIFLKYISDNFYELYHKLEAGEGYEDIPGFCKSAFVADVAALDYVLTSGRYIGLPDDEDDFDFAERIRMLTAELEAQMAEGIAFDEHICTSLAKVEVDGKIELVASATHKKFLLV